MITWIMKKLGYSKYKCPNCKATNYFMEKDKYDSTAGYCWNCDHPVWK